MKKIKDDFFEQELPGARGDHSGKKFKRLARLIGLSLCGGFLLVNSGCKTSGHSSREAEEPRFTFEFAPSITL
jgi:hypothetical protein